MRPLLTRLLVLAGVLRGAAHAGRDPRDPDPDDGVDPRRRTVPADRTAETRTALLLVGSGALFLAFAVLLALEAGTQLLGVAAGGALLLLAAALVLAGKSVVPQETAVQERIQGDPPERTRELEAQLAEPAEGVSRRRLLAAAGGVTATGAVAAAAVPVTALGPSPKTLLRSPWKAGVRLVTEEGAPVAASELEVGSFLTAFPEHAEMRELGASLVVVRVDPASLELPAGREDWAPGGVLAFSKICTHAACAVSLFRHPVVEGLSSGPALVCPCHYSTFDVRRGAQVIFGPAGRPLPQLPLAVDAGGVLVATGPLSGSPGPAWWATRRGGA